MISFGLEGVKKEKNILTMQVFYTKDNLRVTSEIGVDYTNAPQKITNPKTNRKILCNNVEFCIPKNNKIDLTDLTNFNDVIYKVMVWRKNTANFKLNLLIETIIKLDKFQSCLNRIDTKDIYWFLQSLFLNDNLVFSSDYIKYVLTTPNTLFNEHSFTEYKKSLLFKGFPAITKDFAINMPALYDFIKQVSDNPANVYGITSPEQLVQCANFIYDNRDYQSLLLNLQLRDNTISNFLANLKYNEDFPFDNFLSFYLIYLRNRHTLTSLDKKYKDSFPLTPHPSKILYLINLTLIFAVEESIKIEKQEEQKTEKFFNQMKDILFYENDELLIVVPSNLKELKEEGDNQKNCIARNYKESIKERTKIPFFIRKKSDPSKSYLTGLLNIYTNGNGSHFKIYDVLGKYNYRPDKESITFIQAYRTFIESKREKLDLMV